MNRTQPVVKHPMRHVIGSWSRIRRSPSKLPPLGTGVFTAVHGRDAITVRASYLNDVQRRAWLQRLPAAASSMEASGVAEARCPIVSTVFQSPGSALPDATKPEAAHAPLSPVSPLVVQETPVLAIPEEEKRQILDLAAAGHSRRRVCEHVYGAASGRAYERVKAVLDQQLAQTAYLPCAHSQRYLVSGTETIGEAASGDSR